MIVEWTISKKRGNHRPMLRYSVQLEAFERDLAIPQVVIESSIPEPSNKWENHCHPGVHERDEALPDGTAGSCGTYLLFTPSHREKEHSAVLRLPWRENGVYPEVEESFRLLRAEFEAVVKKAYDSRPVDCSGALDMSDDMRRHVASGVAAQRFLQAVGL